MQTIPKLYPSKQLSERANAKRLTTAILLVLPTLTYQFINSLQAQAVEPWQIQSQSSKNNKPPQILPDSSASINLSPEDFRQALRTANSMELHQRNAEAKKIYRKIIGDESKAITLNTYRMRALTKLTRLLLAEGQIDEAQRQTNFLLAHSPRSMQKDEELSVEIDDLANDYLSLNNTSNLRLTHLENCYKLRLANYGDHPMKAEACRYLAKEHVRLGHFPEAEKWQLMTIQYDDDLPVEKKSIEIVDRFMLTQIYTNSGQIEKAGTQSRSALNLCQKYNCANQYRCLMEFQIGKACQAKKQYKEAIEYYTKAEEDGKHYPFRQLDISGMCKKARTEAEAHMKRKSHNHSH
jgi:tetratricopeptide (TPR) repeat protein